MLLVKLFDEDSTEMKSNQPLQTLLFLVVLLAPLQSPALARGTSTAEGPTEDYATVRATRLKPMESEVVNVTCHQFYAAGSQRFRCTAEWISTTEQKRVNWLD